MVFLHHKFYTITDEKNTITIIMLYSNLFRKK